jgi:mannose-6-phosphate isomerase-like protein (cupin superfamily)
MTIDDYRQFRDYIINYSGEEWDIVSFKALLKSKNQESINNLTIDRLDSGNGYLIYNLVKCCWFCNSIKHCFIDAEDMRLIAPKIISKLKAVIDKINNYKTTDELVVGYLGYFQQNFVKKGWGSERWLHNGSYCGKVLTVKEGKKCSFHYHKIKDEVFYLDKGEIIVRYGHSDNIALAEEIHLNEGESFHIPTGLRHQFEAVQDSIIVEFSTHHEDSDSIRIIPGD